VTTGRSVKGAFILLLIFIAANAWAVSSSLWETDSKQDFDAGEVDGVSVTPPGQVVLGPESEETSLDALFAWKLTEDSKGNIYVGSGSDGKIFRVSRKGESEVFAELELQQVFALAVGRKNVLYAAGFPGGKIYSIDKDGAATEHYDTGQDSVWSICVACDGALIAGTGDEGQIFRIEGKDEGSLLYDSPERRILSLLCDAEGDVYAGTEKNGIIYRIDEDGKPFVFFDTELEEVTSMAVDDEGYLYAVSSPGDLFMKIPPKAAPGMPAGGNSAAAPHSAQANAAPVAPGMPALPSGKKRKCFVYKIAKDGTAEKLWTSPDKLIFSLAFDGKNILAGSGDEGIVYLITPTGEDSKYYEVEQKQALDMLRTADGRIAISCGNDAAIVILGEGYAEEGIFVSQVHDATAVSEWGKVFWEADTPSRTSIVLSTRSGNSEKPDDTWSEWSRERGDPDGFLAESPVARFVQWRARLKTSGAKKTPTLKKVTMSYLQRNLVPRIKSITIDGSGGKPKKGNGNAPKEAMSMPGAATGLGAQALGKPSSKTVKAAARGHKTKLKINWKANDANGDELEFELYFKGVDEKRWKLIEDELTEKNHEWDTEAVPDGEYHVRIVASDSPANPEETSLSAERTSEPFIVDNTSPVIESLRAAPSRDKGGYKVTGVVSDNLSPVRSAQYSVDAGDWKSVFPSDGVFDSISEKVEFSVGTLEQGEHTVVLKAVDYFGNVGAGKTTFEAK